MKNKKIILISLILFTAVNLLTAVHAYKMSHFSAGGARTQKPETLTFSEKLKTVFLGVNIPRPVNSKTPADYGLEFSQVTFPTPDGESIQAWLIPSAQNRGTVVLFHGYAASKSSLLEQALLFRRAGYTTLLVDFRGSGGSSGNSTTIGYLEARDVLAAYKYVAANLEVNTRIYLYGRSMGAAAILRGVSRANIRPTGLILECPFHNMLGTTARRFNSMGLPAFPGAHLLVLWGGLVHGYNAFAHNPEDYARNIKTPTLLLFGKKDPRVTPVDGRKLAQNFPLRPRLHIFPESGHNIDPAKTRGAWERVVYRFLAEVK